MALAQPQPLEVCGTRNAKRFLLWGGWGGLEVLRHRAGQDRRSVPKDSYGPLPMSTPRRSLSHSPLRRTSSHRRCGNVGWSPKGRRSDSKAGFYRRPVTRHKKKPKVEVDTLSKQLPHPPPTSPGNQPSFSILPNP